MPRLKQYSKLTKKQLAYLSKKHGKNNVVFTGRYIANPIDEELGISLNIMGECYYIEKVTPKEIKKYIGAVSDWAPGLADVLEKELNSSSLYKG